MQGRSLHLRKRRRAVLPDQRLPDQQRLFELRPCLRLDLEQQHIDLPALRQEGSTVLFQQHVHRGGHTVHVVEQLVELHVQDMRRTRRNLLLCHDREPDRVQGRECCVRQQHEHLQSLRCSRRPLLHKLHLQRSWHDLQELSVPGLRKPRRPVLPR
jgi:hypothetical protein